MTLRTPRLLLSISLLLVSGCGDAPATAEPGAGTPAADSHAALSVEPANGTLHFVYLPNLEGYADGVPCIPDDIPPLAAAARLADSLEAQGDKAILACFGDTLAQPSATLQSPAVRAATIARSNVDLDAMAAAGVDIYVPGHTDMLAGLNDLLDRASARGIPVVLSNVTVEGRDDIQPYVIVEHAGMRFAVLAVIPKLGGLMLPDGIDKTAKVTFSNPGTRIRELSRQILKHGEANAIVCLSSLPNKANPNLCKNPRLHFLIGADDTGASEPVVVALTGTTLCLVPDRRNSVGMTTIRVENDDWDIADISQRHVLPAALEKEREALARQMETYGTEDLDKLAALVLPRKPSNFLLKVELMEENAAWVEKTKSWEGSYLDHQIAPLEPVPEGDPVEAILATRGAVIRSAIAGLKTPVQPLPAERAIPHPDDCRSCHEAQFTHWASTTHASAFERLVQQDRQYDNSCLICHSAGFGLDGGYRDPRHEAPFGAVTCVHCHAVYRPHAFDERLVVDPLYVAAEAESMVCADCHNPNHDPDFERGAALQAIACPPMRADDPSLLMARSRALEALRELSARGEATDWDEYLEGRALVGMGLPDEGLPKVRAFIDGRTDWPQMTYFTAQFLQENGDALGARRLFKEFLASEPGNPQMNLAYIRLLANPDHPSVFAPEHALSHARLIAPPEAEQLDPERLSIYLIQVDMLIQLRRDREAEALLTNISQQFKKDPDVEAALVKYRPQ